MSDEGEVRSLIEDAKEAAEVLRNLVVQSQIDEAGNLSTCTHTHTHAHARWYYSTSHVYFPSSFTAVCHARAGTAMCRKDVKS